MCCSVFYSHLYVTNVSRLQTCIAYWKSLWYTRPPVVDLGGTSLSNIITCTATSFTPFRFVLTENVCKISLNVWYQHLRVIEMLILDVIMTFVHVCFRSESLCSHWIVTTRRGPWWWNHSAMFMVESDY